MARKLRKHLSTMAHMSPEEFAEYEASIVIDTENTVIDYETVDAGVKEYGTNCWACTCGAGNRGKFYTECGKAKPTGIPQYKCDRCGWVPDDAARPPKFCPECGDPFVDGDMVLV